MVRESNVYTLLAILIAIGLAIFSPNIPKISSTIGLINGLLIFFLLILLVMLLDVYLNERRKRIILELKSEKFMKNIEDINKEISFIKERFKIIEDLSETKAIIKLMEKNIFRK